MPFEPDMMASLESSRRTQRWLRVLCTLGCCVWACAGPSARQQHVVVPPDTSERSEFPGAAGVSSAAAAACPMDVKGTDLQLVSVKGGTALVFTTPLESPVELRWRVRRFAAAYDADERAGLERGPNPGSPAGFPTTASYSEVVAGARVEIRPLTAADLPALRSHLRQRAEHMRWTQSC